jgi:hypothetical protein
VSGQEPAELLAVLGRAAQDTVVLEGERGEAAEVTPALLDALAGRARH